MTKFKAFMNTHRYIVAIATIILIGAIIVPMWGSFTEPEETKVSEPEETGALEPEERGVLESGEPTEMHRVAVPFLGPQEIRDPEIAKQLGIPGYLEVSLADPSLIQTVSKGGEVDIPISLHFVSFSDELTEIKVTLDPQSEYGLKAGQHYKVLDDKGNISGEGDIDVNELVSYDTKTVIVKANEIKTITMTVTLPGDLPEKTTLRSISLGAVGISADVPIINDTCALSAFPDGDIFTVREEK